jgi:hypothetical protein
VKSKCENKNKTKKNKNATVEVKIRTNEQQRSSGRLIYIWKVLTTPGVRSN